MTFTEDLFKLNFKIFHLRSQKTSGYSVLTKYVRIAVDVFIKRVFKGNTVTDRDSAPYQTCRRTQIVQGLEGGGGS